MNFEFAKETVRTLTYEIQFKVLFCHPSKIFSIFDEKNFDCITSVIIKYKNPVDDYLQKMELNVPLVL